MSQKIVSLDSRRPKKYVTLKCTFCAHVHAAVVTITSRRQQFYPCPNCDETASVPIDDGPNGGNAA